MDLGPPALDEAGALLGTGAVARALGISSARVLALIHAQRLPARKYGRDWLVRAADLEAVGERRPGRPPRPTRSHTTAQGGQGMPLKTGTGAAMLDRPARVPALRQVLAIGSQKGGVAKTTTTLYLAARAAAHFGSAPARPAVAVVDRDEARNLTALAALRPDILAPGVRLLEGAEVPAASEDYRLVLIDTPPGLSAIDSLREADLLVVPVLPEEQGVANLVRYLRLIEGQRRTISPRLRLLALLPVMVEVRNALHRDMLLQIRRIAERNIAPLQVLPPVPRSNRIARCDLRAAGYNAAAEELLHALG